MPLVVLKKVVRVVEEFDKLNNSEQKEFFLILVHRLFNERADNNGE